MRNTVAPSSRRRHDAEDDLELTHYVPYDTRRSRRGRAGDAACGLTVDLRLHSNDPTCHDCAEFATERQQAAEDRF